MVGTVVILTVGSGFCSWIVSIDGTDDSLHGYTKWLLVEGQEVGD